MNFQYFDQLMEIFLPNEGDEVTINGTQLVDKGIITATKLAYNPFNGDLSLFISLVKGIITQLVTGEAPPFRGN